MDKNQKKIETAKYAENAKVFKKQIMLTKQLKSLLKIKERFAT
jgi:hypothetical protein